MYNNLTNNSNNERKSCQVQVIFNICSLDTLNKVWTDNMQKIFAVRENTGQALI